MKYWLTTHYRHQSVSHPYSIYLRERYRKKESKISIGDGVVFYEIKGKSNGRDGVVVVAKVTGALRANVHRDGGPDISNQLWEWEIPCGEHDSDGFVPKDAVYDVLGWKPLRPMRIPGGLMELDEQEYTQLIAKFKARQ
jgi:hypothetical protein